MSPKEVTYALRAKNLKAWIDSNTTTPAEVGRRVEMTRSHISALLKNKKPFGEGTARRIETGLRMPTMWLDQEQKDGLSTIVTWSEPDELPADSYALIPRVTVELSAGSGEIVNREENMPPLAFTKDWLRSKNVTSKSNLRVCKVSGRSMEPYLMDNDSVLIDLGQKRITDGGIYAIRHGDEVRIKRLVKRFDGGITIKSFNPEYPDEQLTPDEAKQLSVIGLSLWRAG